MLYRSEGGSAKHSKSRPLSFSSLGCTLSTSFCLGTAHPCVCCSAGNRSAFSSTGLSTRARDAPLNPKPTANCRNPAGFAPDMVALCNVFCILRGARWPWGRCLPSFCCWCRICAGTELLVLLASSYLALCNSPNSSIKKKKKRHQNRPKQEQQENLCKHFLLILWVQTLFFILCLEEDANPEAPAEGTWYLLTPQVRQPSSRPTARAELLPTRHPRSSSTYLKQEMPSLSLHRIISNANLKECGLI